MSSSKTSMNVVLIHGDQLRADSVGCYGNPIVRTPNIDRLARSGTRFVWTFAQHPQCAPSRASMLTGRYPHINGGISNHVAMGEHEKTLGEHLQTEGYRTFGVGKLHLFSQKEQASFTDTSLCGGQNSDATSPEVLREDYKQWAKDNGYWKDLKRAYAVRRNPAYRENFQAVVSPMPAEAYIDSWVGDQSVSYIRKQPADEPFFMFVGLPNPHNPFEPPEPYASLYNPDDMPIPETFHSDLSTKPPHQLAYKRYGRQNIGANYEKLDAPRLRRLIAYYYASITLVDDQVGKIMAALEHRQMLDNTLVIFTSDHGELLGHHGMLLKSTDQYPILYDKSLHVPLIIRLPGPPGGRVIEEPAELVDLYPTILDWLKLEIPPEIQGCSLLPAIQGGPAPEREHIFAESGAAKMLRGERHKLVYYPGQSYGELYDIKEDPLEINNLYTNPDYQDIRASMIQRLLDRLIYTEAPQHGESKRGPVYWRTLYRLPFESDVNSS